jgi:hypothetical protein
MKTRTISTENNNFLIRTNSTLSTKNYDPNILKKFRITNFTLQSIRPNKIQAQIVKEEKLKLIKSIISILVLCAFYIGIYLWIIVMLADIYARYRYYILKVWLLPALIQLVLVKFFINLLMNLFKSYMLFKHYSMRKTKCMIKYVYRFFISKDVIYMYRIRNFITKYYNQFNDDDLLKV